MYCFRRIFVQFFVQTNDNIKYQSPNRIGKDNPRFCRTFKFLFISVLYFDLINELRRCNTGKFFENSVKTGLGIKSTVVGYGQQSELLVIGI